MGALLLSLVFLHKMCVCVAGGGVAISCISSGRKNNFTCNTYQACYNSHISLTGWHAEFLEEIVVFRDHTGIYMW